MFSYKMLIRYKLVDRIVVDKCRDKNFKFLAYIPKLFTTFASSFGEKQISLKLCILHYFFSVCKSWKAIKFEKLKY